MFIAAMLDVIKPRGERCLRWAGVDDFTLGAIFKVAVLVTLQVDIKPFDGRIPTVHRQVKSLPAAFR